MMTTLKRLFVAAMFALTLSAAPQAAHAELLDGNWLSSGCYGCPDDKVRGQVDAAISAYQDAAKAVDEDSTVATNVEAAKASIFSWVRAGYLLEAGRISKAAGDAAGAVEYYKSALKSAQAAIDMPADANFKGADGENVPDKSHSYGNRWKAVALKHLGVTQ